MPRRLARCLALLLCTALMLGGTSLVAEAAGTPRVKGVSKAGQDGSALVVRWRAVKGAAYQLRWAGTARALRSAPAVKSSRPRATTRALSRGGTWFVQVRALRAGHAGAWSRPKSMTLRSAARSTASPAPISGRGLPGAVQFSWSGLSGATGYRVEWDAGWSGSWPGAATYVDRTSGGWVGAGARSSILNVPSSPGPGDRLLAVEYGNPVFGRLQTRAKNGGVQRTSRWVPVYPAAPVPPAGDALRVGSYNLQLAPQGGPRVTAIAANIVSHRVDVVALQEANTASVRAVVKALGGAWRSAPANDWNSAVVYRSDKFELQDSGTFDMRHRLRPSRPLTTPWAQLRHRDVPDARPFLVVSAHIFSPGTGNRLKDNRETGLAAQDIDNAMNAVNARKGGLPVIVAGDLQYGREPMTEDPAYLPAQPTLVRRGYYDTLSAQTKIGTDYNTYNLMKRARQERNPTGVAARGDHILVKGIRGAVRYQNVYNWSHRGLVPSDHNLLFADLRIPRT